MRKQFILCLTTLLVLCACGDKNKEQALSKLEGPISRVIGRRTTRTDPVRVKVMQAHSAEGSMTTGYVGRVEPVRSTLVTTPHGGTVVKLRVRAGQRVREGEVLAEIRSEFLQSSYDIAAATLEQAEDGFDRVQKVYDSGSITEQKFMEVRTQLDRARASERAARHALNECLIRAPYAATVSEIFCEQGTQAEAFTPLVQLVDIHNIEVVFAVPERELPSIRIGDEALVSVGALDTTFRATLTVKGVMASPMSHTYDCTLGHLPAVEGLLPGMVCKVSLFTQGQKGLLVPASAVLADREGRYVWMADSLGSVEKRHVVVDGFSGKSVIVKSGLKEGERVIVEGAQKVSTGMKVLMEEVQ